MNKDTGTLFGQVAERILKAPGMIEPIERKLLFEAAYQCTNLPIVEFGAFFGASTLALALGANAKGTNPHSIFCIDAFEVDESHGFHKHVIAYARACGSEGLLKQNGTKSNWIEITRRVLGDQADSVILAESLVNEQMDMTFLPQEIGLLHLDLPKDAATLKPIIREVFPRLVEESTIIFQDYAYQFSNELICFFEQCEKAGVIKPYAIAASTMAYKVTSQGPTDLDWVGLLNQALSNQDGLLDRAIERYKHIPGARNQEIVALMAASVRACATPETSACDQTQEKIRKLISDMNTLDKARASFILAELLTESLAPHG